MIPIFLGLFVLLFGVAIVSNAAFSDRAQFGCWVALIGFVVLLFGIANVAVSFF